MATFSVTEYSAIGADAGGSMQIAAQPSVRTQKLTLSSSSQQLPFSFHPGTRLVRIMTDGACCFRFGVDPVEATLDDEPMAANQTEYFYVQALPNLNVAAIAIP